MKLSKIGDVEFSATTEEEVIHESEVTDRPVEDLGYISDHVKQRPIRFKIEGIVVGSDAWPKLKLLREYGKGKKVYKYFGRNIMSNVVIENITTNHGKNIRNGFEFSMSCKIVKQAVSKKVPVQGKDKAKPKQKAPTKVQTSKTKPLGKKVNQVKKVDKEKAEIHRKLQIKAYDKRKMVMNTVHSKKNFTDWLV